MRAFVGIGMPAAFPTWFQRSVEPLSRISNRLKLVPAASCHMTLQFLGEVSDEQAVDVVRRLKLSLTGAHGTVVSLKRFGIFRRDGSPAVLWAGTMAVSEDLNKLAALVAQSLSGAGSNRKLEHFEPHVTLGRFAPGTRNEGVACIESRSMEPYDVSIESVVFYESLVGQGHPVYVARAIVPLAPFAE